MRRVTIAIEIRIRMIMIMMKCTGSAQKVMVFLSGGLFSAIFSVREALYRPRRNFSGHIRFVSLGSLVGPDRFRVL